MAHEGLTGIMVLIHPPLAILGYLFTFLALRKAAQLYMGRKGGTEVEKDLRISLTIAWWLTFLGLVTGMIWAQIAWGTFWNWDPKETATLFVFLSVTAAYLLMQARMHALLVLIALVLSAIAILVTISLSIFPSGLHSYG